MLEKQIIELPFFQGVEARSDAKQIPLGKLLVCQNAVFTSPGKLQKRTGYTALTTNILGGGTISTGAALFTRANELCMTDTSRNLYSYDASNTAWHNVGKMPSVTATVAQMANPQYTVYGPDMAQAANGLQCCVYELYDYTATSNQKKGVGYTLVDSTTGQIVAGPAIIDNTASTIAPRVVLLGTSFAVCYIQGDLAATADIYTRTLSSTSPTSGWSAATQLTSGVGASAQLLTAGSFQYDVTAGNSAIYISFNNRLGGTTTFHCTSATAVAHTATVAVTASRASCVVVDGSGDVAVAYLSTPNTVSAIVYSSDLSTIKAAAARLDTPSAVAALTVTGASTGTNAITWFFGGGMEGTPIYTNTMSGASYTIGTDASIARNLVIGGKAFAISGSAYLPLWFCPNNAFNGATRYLSPQNSMYLLDSSGKVVSKALYGTEGGLDSVGSATIGFYMVGQTLVSGNTATIPAASSNLLLQTLDPRYPPYVDSAGKYSLNFQFGAVAVSFNFNDTTNNYLRGQLANAVHTSGGVLQMYDGQNVCEHGFLVYPYRVGTTTAGSGGSLSAGTYGYIATYEWMDGQGQLHRSAPSAAVSVTAVANDTVNVTVPTLLLTAKTGVKIQIWRTQVNGTVYYQITNFNASGSLFNSTSANTVTWSDTQSDAAISVNPQLYTTSGELDAGTAPPAGPMTVHRNRLFVVDSTNPYQIFFSKLVFPPLPVEFSLALFLNIDPKGGPITALASLDDKLIIFKSDRIFMVLGQGPDSLGNQNDFTDAMLVSADTGCTFPKSVVITPDGLMFKGAKGIHLLNRALQLVYIGAPVASLGGESSTTRAVSLLPYITKQIWMALPDLGTILVYDWLTQQWSQTVYAGLEGGTAFIDLVTIGTALYSLNDNGTVTQVNGVCTDNTTPFSMTVTTGWIKLSGLQGFQRAWRLLVLGEYASPHTLTVSVAYDYQQSTTQTNTFVISANPDPYQVRVHLAKQKCEAIQITISDSGQSGTAESMKLSGLAIEVGIKRGTRKLAAAQSG